jgi:hypothetical protein
MKEFSVAPSGQVRTGWLAWLVVLNRAVGSVELVECFGFATNQGPMLGSLL